MTYQFNQDTLPSGQETRKGFQVCTEVLYQETNVI